MLSDAIEEVGKFFIRFVVETLFFYTGEFALYCVTLGTKQVRWDFYQDEHPVGLVLADASTVIGFVIWVFAIGFIARGLLGD